MINTKQIDELIEKLRNYLYVGYYSETTYEITEIENDLAKILKTLGVKDYQPKTYTEKLKQIKEALELDVDAFYKGDPAASNRNEIIVTYPGFYAIMVYRLAHELIINKIPLIPRMMSEIAHSKTGIDIHPAAEIGKSFFIDHGTGIVIGETTIIGNNVKIYQGVTLGAISLDNSRKLVNHKRHPTICDNVTIYAGASILGGETVIGNNVIIGSNVFITNSIKDNVMVKLDNKNYRIVDINLFNAKH